MSDDYVTIRSPFNRQKFVTYFHVHEDLTLTRRKVRAPATLKFRKDFERLTHAKNEILRRIKEKPEIVKGSFHDWKQFLDHLKPAKIGYDVDESTTKQ